MQISGSILFADSQCFVFVGVACIAAVWALNGGWLIIVSGFLKRGERDDNPAAPNCKKEADEVKKLITSCCFISSANGGSAKEE